jgi:uncharacterized protein with von Willebrand factor type A (vWA) domain
VSLLDAVVSFARDLRAAGLSVSVSEVADAGRAAGEVGAMGREAFRAALESTLVKEPAHRPIFGYLFDVHFPVRRPLRGRDAERPTPQMLSEALRSGDTGQMQEVVARLLDMEGLDPEGRVGEEHYEWRARRNLEAERVVGDLINESAAGKGLTALQRRLIEDDLRERLERCGEILREDLRARRTDQLGMEVMVAARRQRPPDEVDFLWAREADLEAMRRALGPLARRLHARLTRRRRQAYRGRLDVRRTLRRSMQYGGALVEPRYRRPAAGKPEILMFADISGSMRAFARFALELTYALATNFQRVRTFVFVDGVDEVTRAFETAGHLERALDRIQREAQVVAYDGQSWYGNVFRNFCDGWRRELTPRTTFIILGDARNNFRSAGVEYLHEIHGRVRRLYWLNPEPRSHWGSADSIIGRYAPFCDGVFECRNLKQLEAFVAKMV